MIDAAAALLRFLAFSSALLLVLGVAIALYLRVAGPSGRCARFLLGLLLLSPCLALLSLALPKKPFAVLPPSLALERAEERGTGRAASAVSVPRAEVRGIAAPPARATVGPTSARDGWIAPEAPRGPDPLLLLVGGWALGAVTILLWDATRLAVLLRRLARERPVSDSGALALLATACRETGVRTEPRLVGTSLVEVPFVAGLLRPVVVLPRPMLARPADLRLTLLHELWHLRRRDHLWLLAEIAVRSIYFFHPVVHWALSRWREEREHRCDLSVTRTLGHRARYAGFLLQELQRVRARRRVVPVPALRHGRAAVARRIHRILDERNTAMRTRFRDALGVTAATVALALFLGSGPAPTAAADEDGAAPKGIERVNATPTKDAGVYHVMPVLRELTAVHVIQIGGTGGKEEPKALAPEQYGFDPATGRLKLKLDVPVDDRREMVIAMGHRVVPWQWQAQGPLAEGSVRLLLGDREAVPAKDFEVDHAKGRIRLLQQPRSEGEIHYYLVYGYVADPAKPDVSTGGAIGNHPDKEAVRRFLRLPEAGATGPAPDDSVGTNASATSDPRVFTLTQALGEGLRVAIVAKGEPAKQRVLREGEDFKYDAGAAKIVLLGDLSVDPEKEFLFVSGVPRDRGVFHFHEPIEQGSVKVIVGSRRAQEGRDFKVDYGRGVVTVLLPEIRDRATKFLVVAGGRSHGNHDDRELVRRLLAE